MARASTWTIIPLDTYAKLLGIDPFHFNGVFTSDAEIRPTTNKCDDIWMQYAWQSAGRVSREDLALALREVEESVADFLHYPIGPSWVAEEEVQFVRPQRLDVYGVGMQPRMRAKSLQLKYGLFIEAGLEATTLITAATAITYSDPDEDGYDEVATMSVTVASGREPCEIGIYYPGHAGEREWEIRPATVTVVGTVATIVANRHQFVLEAELETFQSKNGVEGKTNGNFLTTVDVYRRYTDPQQQATFTWEMHDSHLPDTQDAFLAARNKRSGIVVPRPGDWDADTSLFTLTDRDKLREPDYVQVWYKAGLIDDHAVCDKLVGDRMARLIAHYASTRVHGKVSECDHMGQRIQYFRQDLARTTDTETFQIGERVLNNPFGTTRAGIELYNQLWRHVLPLGQAAQVD